MRLLERKVLLVLQVLLGLRVQRVQLQLFLDQLVLRVQLERREFREFKVFKVLMGQQVQQDLQGQRVQQDRKASKVFKVMLALLDQLVLQGQLVQQDRLVQQVQRALQGTQFLVGLLTQPLKV